MSIRTTSQTAVENSIEFSHKWFGLGSPRYTIRKPLQLMRARPARCIYKWSIFPARRLCNVCRPNNRLRLNLALSHPRLPFLPGAPWASLPPWPWQALTHQENESIEHIQQDAYSGFWWSIFSFETKKSGKTPEVVHTIIKKKGYCFGFKSRIHDYTEEDLVKGLNLPG